jgi:hypothetical protein
LHEHSDKQEKASHEDKEKDHVVDVVSVFALPAFPQKILDFFVGHVGLFTQSLALIVNVILIVVLDQKPMSVDKECIIEKIDDKKEAKEVVQIIIQDHGQAVRAGCGVRLVCTVIGSMRVMVGAPCFF